MLQKEDLDLLAGEYVVWHAGHVRWRTPDEGHALHRSVVTVRLASPEFKGTNRPLAAPPLDAPAAGAPTTKPTR